MTLNSLQESAKDLPKSPGVYIMKNVKGEILYVGKASNLRSRVYSYFSKEAESRHQVRFLMPKVDSIETIITSNPKEALLLENTLIKKHRPRYNIELKDDKSYVSLKLSLNHEAPRLYVTRRIKKDGGLYYGPFTSAGSVREVVDFIQRNFRLRTCSDHDYRNRVRPCLQYQIKRCDAPCVGLVSTREYQKLTAQVRLFLEGRNDELKKRAKEVMRQASAEERYEDAARFRDLVLDIEKTMERQKVVSHHKENRDVVSLYREGEYILINLMIVREGSLQDSRSFNFRSYLENGEVLETFLAQYYQEGRVIPGEILLPFNLEDQNSLEEIFSERSGHRVRIQVPRRGEKLAIVDLAHKNAQQAFTQWRQRESDQKQILVDLKRGLRLQNLPEKIECYDISNFQGGESMGSMVTFVEGKAEPKLYRHFRIKTVQGANDFASLYEVLSRRLRRARDTGEGHAWSLPDLLVMDGGKGQLHAAAQALKDEGVEGVDLISLAKSRLQVGEGIQEAGAKKERSDERVFLLGRKDPVLLPKNSSSLFLLMKARDEAHRFGIEAHRKWRKRRSLQTALDEVEGVGKVRRQKLLKQFGSMRGIREASVAQIQAAIGVPGALAQRIKESI